MLSMHEQVLRQSRLYESAPAYVTDQPRFVNGALAALTSLPPLELLDALKSVEVIADHRPMSSCSWSIVTYSQPFSANTNTIFDRELSLCRA